MSLELDKIFRIDETTFGEISECFSQGINYHTLDKEGNCIKGQQYVLRSDFNFTIIEGLTRAGLSVYNKG